MQRRRTAELWPWTLFRKVARVNRLTTTPTTPPKTGCVNVWMRLNLFKYAHLYKWLIWIIIYIYINIYIYIRFTLAEKKSRKQSWANCLSCDVHWVSSFLLTVSTCFTWFLFNDAVWILACQTWARWPGALFPMQLTWPWHAKDIGNISFYFWLYRIISSFWLAIIPIVCQFLWLLSL